MHNPLRSEAEMFRVVVIVGIAMGLVIAVALIIDPLAGAILFGIELGVLIGVLYSGARGSLPRTAEVASSDDSVHRILVVANQTVGGRALLEELKGRVAGEPSSEILVVTPPLAGSAAEHWSSDIDEGIAEAKARLEASVATMKAEGLKVTDSSVTTTTRTRRSRTRWATSRRTRSSSRPIRRSARAGSKAASSRRPGASCRSRSRTLWSISRPSRARRRRPPVSGYLPPLTDCIRYWMSFVRSGSGIWVSSNVGIALGDAKPWAIFACGSRMDAWISASL